MYNDRNSDLVNLFRCAKDRPVALIRELGFLPLHARDDFDVILKYFQREEFTSEYLREELELTKLYLPPLKNDELCELMLQQASEWDVRRAALYFRLIRESFSGAGNAFAGRDCDLRRFFYLIWECSRRLKDVVIENRDFEDLIRQYDRKGALIYCDPPYYKAEKCYQVVFTEDDHIRLRNAVKECAGYVMVSYNCCDYIRELYQDFFIFYTERPNSMSQEEGSKYEEYVITNYDPRLFSSQMDIFRGFPDGNGKYEVVHKPEIRN